MRNWRLMMSGLLGLVLLLALACGGAAAPADTPVPPQITSPPPVTDAPTDDTPAVSSDDGEALFTGSGGCAACHTIEGLTLGPIGPDLTHIGTDAGTRKPGVSAEDYIIESIREPEAFVPEDVVRATPGLMTSALTDNLTDGQVDALVEFLLKQK